MRPPHGRRLGPIPWKWEGGLGKTQEESLDIAEELKGGLLMEHEGAKKSASFISAPPAHRRLPTIPPPSTDARHQLSSSRS